MTPRLAVAVLALSASVPPSPAAAQAGDQGNGARVAGACDFRTCGLRLEAGALLRGAGDERVGGYGFWGDDFRILHAGPDSAAAWAERFEANDRWADRLFALGFLGAVVGMGVWRGSFDELDDDAGAVEAAGLLTYIGSFIVAGRLQKDAGRALTRSVWWYNQGVADDPSFTLLEPTGPWPPSHARTGFWVGAIAGAGAGVALSDVSWSESPGELLGYTALNALVGAGIGMAIGKEFRR